MSENLFICGNGFDLAHGFKTSYSDFKKWMKKHYKAQKINNHEQLSIPDYEVKPNGIEEYNDSKIAAFLLSLLNEVCTDDWCTFESDLAKLNWDRCFDKNINCNVCYIAKLLITEFFPRWVRNINISNPSSKFENLSKLIDDLDNKNYFLSFNYTETLERHYNAEKVCHIHGSTNDCSKLIVGHGEPIKDNELDDRFEVVDAYKNKLYNQYKKNTEEAFEKNISFFNSLQDIKNIYIYGFSFSEVDMFYLKKIAQRVNVEDIRIYLQCYDESKRPKFTRKLIELGFLKDNISVLTNDFKKAQENYQNIIQPETFDRIEKKSKLITIIVALLAPVVGAYISLLFYSYYHGYYEYLKISETWLDMNNDNSKFYPIFMIFIALFIMAFNVLPFLLIKYDKPKKWKFFGGVFKSTFLGIVIYLFWLNFSSPFQAVLLLVITYGIGYIEGLIEFVLSKIMKKHFEQSDNPERDLSIGIMIIAVMFIAVVFGCYFTGYSTAQNKKEFKMIDSSTVILHETQDKFIIAEVEIDEDNNILTIFPTQTVIENTDVSYEIKTFAKVIPPKS